MSIQLIYAFDPLCGWCFGFTPVIEDFAKSHPETSVRVVPGGMMVGDREGPLKQVAPYIAWAYKDVERVTGVKFGPAFLEGPLKEGNMVLASIPLCKAMSVVNIHLPNRALGYAAKLHSAVYVEGMAPLDRDLYRQLARDFGLDGGWFVAEMDKEETVSKMNEDFGLTRALGVRGFPSVFATDGKKIISLGSGYMPPDTLAHRYGLALDMLAQEI